MTLYPTEITQTLQTLERAGNTGYLVGDAARLSLFGLRPSVWTLASNASPETLAALFARPLSPDGSLRWEAGGQQVHLRSYRRKEDLWAGRVFTCDAVALSLHGAVLDPFQGQQDIRARSIRTIAAPMEVFAQDPLQILRAIRRAGETGYTLEPQTLRAAKKQAKALRQAEPHRLREETEAILLSPGAGEGLTLLGQIDCLPALIGLKRARVMKRRQLRAFADLRQHLDELPAEPALRWAMFYLCFQGDHMLELARRLPHQEETLTLVEDGERLLPRVSFLRSEAALKDFLARYGLARYQRLHRLARARNWSWGPRRRPASPGKPGWHTSSRRGSPFMCRIFLSRQRIWCRSRRRTLPGPRRCWRCWQNTSTAFRKQINGRPSWRWPAQNCPAVCGPPHASCGGKENRGISRSTSEKGADLAPFFVNSTKKSWDFTSQWGWPPL